MRGSGDERGGGGGGGKRRKRRRGKSTRSVPRRINMFERNTLSKKAGHHGRMRVKPGSQTDRQTSVTHTHSHTHTHTHTHTHARVLSVLIGDPTRSNFARNTRREREKNNNRGRKQKKKNGIERKADEEKKKFKPCRPR